MTFAQLLKHARVNAELTQHDLAEATGYSVSLIRKLEGGQRRPNAETIQQLATALHLSQSARAALLAASGLLTRAVLTPVPLPIPPTQLIGRTAAVAELIALVQQHRGRLLSLLGPPGVGKTRLALATAEAMRNAYTDGVWWVPLAPLQTVALLVPTLLRLLGSSVGGAGTPLEQLVARIGERPLLLALDNLEHLLPEAGRTLATLLEQCPGLVLLVTSRLPLRLRAEQRYEVAPLALPPGARLVTSPADTVRRGRALSAERTQAIAATAAVRLFVERATAVTPDFRLTAQNAQTIAAVVRRLDGLPLAIELAAAQLDRLSVEALWTDLSQRFDLLNDGPYDLPDRQRTLAATIAWSYDLLVPAARAAFDRLGVFVGGCTAAAAQALECGEWLETLCEAGLVVREPGRWSLLETLRAFAIDRLRTAADGEVVRRAHASFFCDLVEQAEVGLLAAEQLGWLAQIDVDLDNIRAALSWSVRSDPALALRLSAALYMYWTIRTRSDEGLDWMQQALTAAQVLNASHRIDERLRAKALQWAGYMWFNQGDREAALPYLSQAIAIHEQYPLSVDYAAALNTLGLVQRMRGQFAEAQQLHRAALTVFEQFGATHGAARVLVNLGLVTMALGDAATAYQQLGAAVDRWQQLGNAERVANASVLQAIAASVVGRHTEAISLATAALETQLRLGAIISIAECERVIGQAYGWLGDYRQAYEHFRSGIRRISEYVGINGQTVAECEYLAEIALLDGDGERGLRWLAACEAWRTQTQIPTHPDFQVRYSQAINVVRARIGEARWHQAWAAGSALSIDALIAELLALRV